MSDENIQLVDYYIRMNWHKLSRMYNNKAMEYGLTISTGYILLIIDKEGTPSTQLGPKMGMEPTSLSRTLKSMEDAGLIYRKQADGDYRKVLVFLTEKGVELRKLTKSTILEFNEKLKIRVSPAKLKSFYEVMKTIDTMVEKELNAHKNKKQFY
ncbi:MAG: MarR family transcriptional regulator [Flavobacteriia bacterium]|nr:MarR family transcriptional regulator [Flavobacteriia bacterium]OJX39704.1 MAG: hypothetical protein BGO87_01750 [Flavobacteriia bacterium 40-80]